MTLLGGGAAAWPLAAHAQQTERMRRIGVLMTTDDAEGQARMRAFLQGLQHLGWVDGRNVRIEARWTVGKADNVRRYVAELAALAPDVILAATGTATTAPLLKATRTLPIVFVIVIDPVGAGFVASLARPGGNATGFLMFEYGLSGKWLELLKQIAPGVTRAAVSAMPQPGRNRPVRCHPGCGAVTQCGGQPGQCARRRRDRARHHGIRAHLEWWPDRTGRCVGCVSSRFDIQSGGATQITCGLL